jgi:hypothetical protein
VEHASADYEYACARQNDVLNKTFEPAEARTPVGGRRLPLMRYLPASALEETGSECLYTSIRATCSSKNLAELFFNVLHADLGNSEIRIGRANCLD